MGSFAPCEQRTFCKGTVAADDFFNASERRGDSCAGDRDAFSHTRPNGESCFTVLDEVGIGNYQSAGENIAAGQNSPAAVMNSWMNSEGHRNNILSASYKHIGVGMKHEPNSIYGKHWVQLFCAGFSERYTECSLMLPSSMQFPLGTSISSMGIAVRLRSNVWGDCYMPLSDEFCTGFNSGSAGEQTVTVNIEGCTAVFPLFSQRSRAFRGMLTATAGSLQAMHS